MDDELQREAYLGPAYFPKIFLQYLSHQIFKYMHEALNVVEKITNYTVEL